ncbi:MAG: MBL fold metallo-hydrolase [Bacteroidetes bacterium]|nr:MBL fold metallo-hydrolase [Bacteroidota bacterium]
MIKITIHRGTDEIGGSCVELTTDATRILIDIGERLEPVNVKKAFRKQGPPKFLPKSLTESLEKEPPIAAILISHAHRDHFGLLPLLPASIPVYMSEGSKIMLNLSEYFRPESKISQKVNTFPLNIAFDTIKHEFTLGDFTITPFLADHSAMDACSFLIEAGGKQIFYSGDIRAHGRKKVMFDRLVSKPPNDIDALVLEGTTLGRVGSGASGETELEDALVKVFRAADDLCLASFSSQNIDRLVTVYRACIKSGKTLVIDPYTAYILEKVHHLHKSIPNWDSDNMAVFYTKNSHTKLLEKEKLLHNFDASEWKIDDLRKNRKRIVMKMNFKNRFILEKLNMLHGSTLIWSQWGDYIRQEELFWKKNGIQPKFLHVSGHAYKKDLQRLVNSMKPCCIIPIHTQYKKDYPAVFAPTPVKILEDGKVVKIKL